jgi:hypothetical protein
MKDKYTVYEFLGYGKRFHYILLKYHMDYESQGKNDSVFTFAKYIIREYLK